MRRDLEGIHVPIFDNDTFRRGLEFGLTKAVKDEILFRTRLKIVDKEDADAILYGKIADVQENVLSENIADDIVEGSVTVLLDIKLVDARTGRNVIEKKGLQWKTEYIGRRGEAVSTAENEAFVDIAERIVNLMEEDW
ncbi:MAG: LptE family protein [Candidatus Brocadiales bacterium]|nr:hypothetical protein [Planctomycetota bacterium]MDO8093575.1 LptE family protein [Candidatus Brocadiales bacterium]